MIGLRPDVLQRLIRLLPAPWHPPSSAALWRRKSDLSNNLFVLAAILAVSLVSGLICIIVGDFAAVRPAFAVVLPIAILMVFAFLLQPKWLVVGVLLLRAVANPLLEQTKVPGVGGLGGLTNLLIIGLAFLMASRATLRIPKVVWWTFLPFMLMQLIGLTYSPDLDRSARLVLGQLSTFAMFVLAFQLVEDEKSFDQSLKVLMVSSVFVAAYTVYAIAAGVSHYTPDAEGAAVSRYSGPFPHANILACYLVLMVGIVLLAWKQGRIFTGLTGRLACVLYLLALLVLVFITKTRGAWVALVFLFFLYGAMYERRYLVYLVIGAMLAMLVPDVRDRVLDITHGNQVVQYGRLNTFAWRVFIWQCGLSWMEPARYLTGYGGESFAFYSNTFFPQAFGGHPAAHNIFVQVLFEWGLLGFLALLWMFWNLLRSLLKSSTGDPFLAPIGCGLIAAYVLMSSSDNVLAYIVFNLYFWYAVGIILAVTVPRQVDVPSLPRRSPAVGRATVQPAL